MSDDYEKKQADLIREVTGWDDVKVVNRVIGKMHAVSFVPIGQIGFCIVAELEDGSHVGMNLPFGLIMTSDIGKAA